MINNYLKKKTETRARIAATEDPKVVEMFETVRDEETDTVVEVSRGTTRVKHLNDLIASAVAAKDAFVAAYQPELDKLNKKIQNLRDIKTDVKALTGETLK